MVEIAEPYSAKQPLTTEEVAIYYAVTLPRMPQNGAEWRCPCPIHHGIRDSFAVVPATGLWFCHSQCQRGGDIYGLQMTLTGVDFKRASQAVDQIVGRSKTNRLIGRAAYRRTKGRIVETYDYTDEAGKLLFQSVRHDPKEFSQRRPDGHGGWIGNMENVRRVLYRLPKLKDAGRVFVVEGEKDVHSIEKLGLTGTCNPMGAGKWLPAYCEVLTAKRIVIIPDADEAGRNHAATVARSLLARAADVRMVELPGAKDISEWLLRGGTLEHLEALVGKAKPIDTLAASSPLDGADLPFTTVHSEAPDESGVTYRCTPTGLLWVKRTRDGVVNTKLTNFDAKIIADVLRDDGTEQTRLYEIKAGVNGGSRTFTLPATQFAAMNWPGEKLGAKAIVYAGSGVKDHARAAIQTLSDRISERTLYTHTGWRKVGNDWIYLHAEGAIGATGAVVGLDVELTPCLGASGCGGSHQSLCAHCARLQHSKVVARSGRA